MGTKLVNGNVVNTGVDVNIPTRICVGSQTISVLTSGVSTLTVPALAVVAEIQSDGAAVSITQDGTTTPTATVGQRIDDGVTKTIDTPLANVKLIARVATTNVQVFYYDRA